MMGSEWGQPVVVTKRIFARERSQLALLDHRMGKLL
jgi:hypothetical protein